MADKLNLPLEHTENHIVAQRRYVCCECGGHIEALDVYQHFSGLWPAERHRSSRYRFYRTCQHCETIRDWLCNETDWPGIGGVPQTWMFRRLRQHLLDQARTGDRAFRMQALRRVVEMNRRRTAAKASS